MSRSSISSGVDMTVIAEEHVKSDKDSGYRSSSVEWPTTRKLATLSVTCLVCFVVGINSTAILSAVDEICEEFNVDLESFDNSFFMVTAWNAGAAIVPLILLPAMEDFGVRPIYFTIYGLFFIFVVVQAVAQNYATMIVSRLIAGSCGGALQNAVDGMASDIWGDDLKKKALTLTVFVFVLLGGVTIGPVVGGAIIKTLSWRWILYVQLIIYGAIAPLILVFLHETRRQSQTEFKGSAKSRIKEALHETVLRSSRLLCTEFTVSSFTLWSSFAFGTVFLLTQSIPLVYGTLYQWPAWKSGLVQIAIFIGEVIGLFLCIVQDTIVYPRFSSRSIANRHQEASANSNPEARLYTAIPASFFGLSAGLFIYAWTSDPSDGYPWPLPTLGLLLIGIGITVIVQAVSTYITDCYASQANSAISAVAFGENIFAAFLPLATRDMYQTLGYPWASSLLGFIGLLVSCAPVILVIFGSRIRSRSAFTN